MTLGGCHYLSAWGGLHFSGGFEKNDSPLYGMKKNADPPSECRKKDDPLICDNGKIVIFGKFS